jgi:glutamate synthase (ferredoxin)
VDRRERDACGIGFVARLHGGPSHEIVCMALEALANHVHRGALAADGKTGDGAGLLTQIPYGFFARELERLYQLDAPPPEDLAIGMVFCPRTTHEARVLGRKIVTDGLVAEGLEVLGWRTVPIDESALGRRARASRPEIGQVMVARGRSVPRGDGFEMALYRARKRIRQSAQRAGIPQLYLPSLSHRTIVYKGLLMAPLLGAFYPDLREEDFTSQVAVFHQRYSTNTFSTWRLAQPFRMICHNGEINTLQGNVSWLRAREAAYKETIWGEEYDKFFTIVDREGSDSAIFDNALELFVRMGYDPRHALLMMVPEAWEKLEDAELTGAWRAFYRYHESLLEPWDGPAALAFTDGRHAGLCLDRNGLRPARFVVTRDGLVVASSEAGALEVDESTIIKKGMLGAGQIIACDLERGELLRTGDIKDLFAHAEPYGTQVARRFKRLRQTRAVMLPHDPTFSGDELHRRKAAFGHTHEDEIMVLRPMVTEGREPVGSMGDDTPLAVLSKLHRPLFHYLKQRFAQVTNPPIDPIRESIVMSLRTHLGRRGNVLNPTDERIRVLDVEGPVLDPGQFANVCSHGADRAFRPHTIDTTWEVELGVDGLEEAIERVRRESEAAIDDGHTLLVLSDRRIGPDRSFIPSLLATSAVHHHLIRAGKRLRASLVLDTGEPREVHHFACLLGFGADAIHPYLVYATVWSLIEAGGRHVEGLSVSTGVHNFIAAVHKGILKVMSKMGISLLASYRGAQTFEAVGLDRDLVRTYLPGTVASLGGVGFDRLAHDLTAWHTAGFPRDGADPAKLPSLGLYKFKKGAELHAYSPAVAHALHAAVGLNPKKARGEQRPITAATAGPSEAWRRFTELVDGRAPVFIRDLLRADPVGEAVPLDEVEPVGAIVRRFSTGAMSHGALSAEAHETLAEAMHRIGGDSNSGEGGEAPERYGTERNSSIKQVASGRFGVTAAYLASGSELQIKMAQGSKPGEGGQLPGHKVTDEIARNRHTTPGVALISPPPHHDIYSIEDLAQLIHDLKQANPEAKVSVKLVAESGVGTIACGVAKGWADVIQVSGATGGTGASPLSSVKHAGLPWELGLAETQRALIENRLRDRVRVRVDGTLQTGRDVIIAALLGADEFSFGTSALIAEGCIMARTCHTNRCPVGVATQKKKLRERFPGLADHVASYFLQLAEDVRQHMARLGFRTIDDMIGRTECLRQGVHGPPADHLDLSELLWAPEKEVARRNRLARNDPLAPTNGYDLGQEVAARVLDVIERGDLPVTLGGDRPVAIRNVDRSVGARLAFHIARRHGVRGMRRGSVRVRFRGNAGQSFGAFLPRGVSFELQGAANDYVGKGLSGGDIVIRRPAEATYRSHKNVIIGNTVLYGATSGRLFAAGRAGQRFCVRNSGALAVVEGAGDHCCEYMTGGVAVILGRVGRNFGAGMTGGVAYVYDEDERLLERLNGELVEAMRITDPRHEEELLSFVRKHRKRSGSSRARQLLDRWDELYIRFWRVAPRGAVASIEARNEGVSRAGRAGATAP